MDLYEFSTMLIETEDLDPVYCALTRSDITGPQLDRWLLAYWMFYDSGVASYMSELTDEDQYWQNLWTAAVNIEPSPIGGRWRRAPERRHFRGKTAQLGVKSAHEACNGDVSDLIRSLHSDAEVTIETVATRAKAIYGFGPWIAFKMADMLDRVCGVPVTFEQGAVFMFKVPAESAAMVWAEKGNDPAAPLEEKINAACEDLASRFGHLKAPPKYDRLIGFAETETMLCKYKSHRSGHYPVQNDTIEIRASLKPWLKINETANRFYTAMPEIKNA